MVTLSCTLVQNWVSSGSVGYTFPRIRVRSQHCQLLLQARQPKAMKWSPPRAATPTQSVESPKAKRSGHKGGPHHSSGYSSNTSTPKCPNSTSAKKPSSSKEPASNEQEKSPRARGSCKCGCSPSLSTESVQCPACLTGHTMLQWMRDIPPPQVPQELKGLIRRQEEKEEEGSKPHQVELQPHGMQGWQPLLGWHPPQHCHFTSVLPLSQ